MGPAIGFVTAMTACVGQKQEIVRPLMFENRSLRIDLFTLVLLAVTALVGVSAGVTYNAGDPPSSLVQPPRTEFQNAVGPIGAYVSHFLLESIGVGAYYFVGSLAALVVVLLWRRGINQPIVRAVGWALSLVALSTLANMLMPNSTPGPEIGAGGFLGAMGSALLESHFATAGAYILSAQLAVGRLAAMYRLFALPRGRCHDSCAPSRGIAYVGSLVRSLKSSGKKRPATDLEEVRRRRRRRGRIRI